MVDDGAKQTVVSEQDRREQLAVVSADMRDLTETLCAEMRALCRQLIGAIGLMLLVHLCAVWGIVAAYAP